MERACLVLLPLGLPACHPAWSLGCGYPSHTQRGNTAGTNERTSRGQGNKMEEPRRRLEGSELRLIIRRLAGPRHTGQARQVWYNETRRARLLGIARRRRHHPSLPPLQPSSGLGRATTRTYSYQRVDLHVHQPRPPRPLSPLPLTQPLLLLPGGELVW